MERENLEEKARSVPEEWGRGILLMKARNRHSMDSGVSVASRQSVEAEEEGGESEKEERRENNERYLVDGVKMR